MSPTWTLRAGPSCRGGRTAVDALAECIDDMCLRWAFRARATRAGCSAAVFAFRRHVSRLSVIKYSQRVRARNNERIGSIVLNALKTATPNALLAIALPLHAIKEPCDPRSALGQLQDMFNGATTLIL
jgi:hypothetical protein